MSFVSIIIPCHNPNMFLRDAVLSVLKQTYQDFEIIIINDGSDQQAAEIFRQCQLLSEKIKIISLPVNKGVAHARNLGIKNAKGDYLAFLDQDDLWHADKLKLQLEYLAMHPDHDFLTSRQRYFLTDGVTNVPSWVKKEHVDTDLPGFLPGTLMARKNAFAKIGIFNESLKAGTDDVDWFFRAKQASLKTAELTEQLLLKRIHQGNLSKDALQHNRELLSVVKMNMLRIKQAKISVIIPCFNAKKYIKEAIDSALMQGDIIGEIIIIDDESSDGSADYVKGLDLAKVKLICLPENKGISGARNAGISVCKFPFIAFLDADDLWSLGSQSKLLSSLQRDNNVWAFGQIEHFSESNKYVLPKTQIGYFASSMLIKTDVFKQVGFFNEELRVGEFIEWYDRARKIISRKPSLLEEVVLKRRIHGANNSIIASKKNQLDYLKVARAAIARKKLG